MDDSNIPQVKFFKKDELAIEFEIMAIEDLFSKHEKLIPPLDRPHRVKFHNVLYITVGEGIHHVDFQPYTFSAGSFLFISPGQVHSFDVCPEIRGYFLLFTANYLEKNLIHSDVLSLYRLYNYHLHAPIMQPEETRGEGFESLLREIMREYATPASSVKEEIIRLFLKVLFLKVERIKQTVTAEQKKTDWLVRFGHFKEHLQNHIASTRSVTEFAAMLNISPKHLNTICKAVSGTTAKQYIDSFVILEIKRILATSDSSVQEISYNFGFEESTNFVKYFKKHTGKSPAQFRKTLTK